MKPKIRGFLDLTLAVGSASLAMVCFEGAKYMKGADYKNALLGGIVLSLMALSMIGGAIYHFTRPADVLSAPKRKNRFIGRGYDF